MRIFLGFLSNLCFSGLTALSLASCTTPHLPTQSANTSFQNIEITLNVIDSRPKEQIDGSIINLGGNTHELIGDSTLNPTLARMLAERVQITLGAKASGKTLEIVSTRAFASPTPKGVSAERPPPGMPLLTAGIGWLLWRGIDSIIFSPEVTVLIQGRLDGDWLFGEAKVEYRNDVRAAIIGVTPKVLDLAMVELKKSIEIREKEKQELSKELGK
jgi:hypothetical protein